MNCSARVARDRSTAGG